MGEKMRYLKFLSVILFVFSFCSEQVVEPMRVRFDDYMIYEKVLEKFVSDQNAVVVLNDFTYAEFSIYANPEHFVAGLSGLSTETLENYMSINQEKMK
jgi:hypothetical protein